jgi:hypothetical protein
MIFDVERYKLHTEAVISPLVKEFKVTPLIEMVDLPRFNGAGVYALYMTNTENTVYNGVLKNDVPIYIGKAVPEGWRQGRVTKPVTTKLRARINEHKRSIDTVNLSSSRFMVRFAILDGEGLDLISALESALIREFKPIWNSFIDGFGNHDPGSGRYEQSPSEWDTLHSGRIWADRLTGVVPALDNIMRKIESY